MSTEGSCALCQRVELDAASYRELYRYSVCKQCVSDFANARTWAFFIDYILLWASSLFPPLLFATIPLFLLKDGFPRGSPGKWIYGLRVIQADSGKPASLMASILRNVFFFIPVLPLFVFNQAGPPPIGRGRGERLFDEFAGTRVIWWKYRHRPPFSQFGQTENGYLTTHPVSPGDTAPRSAFTKPQGQVGQRGGSRWIYWTFVPWISWVGWVHAAIRSRHALYLVFGALYACPLVLAMVFDPARNDWLPVLGIVGWIVGIIHSQIAKRGVNARIAARAAVGRLQ